MAYRGESQRGGYVHLDCQHNVIARFRPEEFHEILTAWKAGQAFYDGIDLYGCPQTVKLGAVVSVSLDTPESIAAYDAEQDDEKAYRLAHGEADA